MIEEAKFEIRDPTGTLFTLTEREAAKTLAWLDAEAESGEPLGDALHALRQQLSEWVDREESQ